WKYGYLYDAALCERAMGQALIALGSAEEGRSYLESAAEHFEAIQARPEVERTRAALTALV
ncbi:MAG: hypothetical protein JO318_00350, partial [Chloroflexi bacterium]|nr:hypothetical protein [Chloroflexota bacterium]